jgi:hypothetical protein
MATVAANKDKERAKREREQRREERRRAERAAAAPAPRAPPPRLKSDDVAGLRERARTIRQDLPIDLVMADIQGVAKQINEYPIVLATHAIEREAKHRACFLNVLEKCERDGGTAVWGWTFHAALTPAGPYAWVNHHGMWMPPDREGELVDVTPFPDTEKDHPALVDGQVAFLPQPSASPFIADGVLGPLPQRFFVLGTSPSPVLLDVMNESNRNAVQNFEAEVSALRARLART